LRDETSIKSDLLLHRADVMLQKTSELRQAEQALPDNLKQHSE